MSKLDSYNLPLRTQQWILGSPFEKSAVQIGKQLTESGYKNTTIVAYLGGVCHFAHWARQERLSVKQIQKADIERFIDEHLVVCDCAPQCRRDVKTVRAALNFWHRYATAHGLVKQAPDMTSTWVLDELAEFGRYLSEIRGLQPSTCDTRTRHVGEFLVKCFVNRSINIELLTPQSIIDYMTHRTSGWKPASIKMVCTSLSCYLRFKAISGPSTTKLIAALPKVPQWRLTSLPKALSSDELHTLLSTFDLQTHGGLRDYAIARCYVDLGLRTAEIARLALDDIDWSHGIVHIRGKGVRVDAMPLPDQTGRAIAKYLKRRESSQGNRALFLRLRPPYERSVTADTIRGSIRNAAVRCGLSDRLTGPHKLRHTLAIRLIGSGVSLKEISDLLRHRNLDTTTVYAKTDMDALWNVASDWPVQVR